MLSRQAKTLFYALAGPVMKANGLRHRRFSTPAKASDGKVKVHLGPGQRKYIDEWINIDANTFSGKCDIWADLRNPLPLPDACADAVYSHHVVEHLPDVPAHFGDVLRVLKPGGIYRVGGPNGDTAVRKFMEGDRDWFSEYPDSFDSVGGRFANFILCRNEHLAILTESYLQEIAQKSGFKRGAVMFACRDTNHPEIFAPCLQRETVEDPAAPATLILEFEK
jgi:SAM-dependent methyltransferase